MKKDDLINYGLISAGVVLGASFFAKALFAWIEDLLFKKGRDEKSLEDLIRSKRYSMGGLSEKEIKLSQLAEKKGPRTAEIADLREEDPREVRKREIMHRIYDLDPKRATQESELAYHLRLLGLRTLESEEGLRRAFKQRAKEFHPDMFVLTDFDKKVQKRLAGRIHENYVAIQKSYDYLKTQLK